MESTQPSQLQGFLLCRAVLGHTAWPAVSIAGLGKLQPLLSHFEWPWVCDFHLG